MAKKKRAAAKPKKKKAPAKPAPPAPMVEPKSISESSEARRLLRIWGKLEEGKRLTKPDIKALKDNESNAYYRRIRSLTQPEILMVLGGMSRMALRRLEAKGLPFNIGRGDKKTYDLLNVLTWYFDYLSEERRAAAQETAREVAEQKKLDISNDILAQKLKQLSGELMPTVDVIAVMQQTGDVLRERIQHYARKNRKHQKFLQDAISNSLADLRSRFEVDQPEGVT